MPPYLPGRSGEDGGGEGRLMGDLTVKGGSPRLMVEEVDRKKSPKYATE